MSNANTVANLVNAFNAAEAAFTAACRAHTWAIVIERPPGEVEGLWLALHNAREARFAVWVALNEAAPEGAARALGAR